MDPNIENYCKEIIFVVLLSELLKKKIKVLESCAWQRRAEANACKINSMEAVSAFDCSPNLRVVE